MSRKLRLGGKGESSDPDRRFDLKSRERSDGWGNFINPPIN
jgi:hypothetical protein